MQWGDQEPAGSLRLFFDATRPAGLISWWRAENNASNAIGGNHGVAVNVPSYRAGKLGATFLFHGTHDFTRMTLRHAGGLDHSGSSGRRQCVDRYQILWHQPQRLWSIFYNGGSLVGG